MKSWVKWAIAGVTAAGVGIGALIYRDKRTAGKLVVVPSGMIHKLDLTGITVRIDTVIKNPTANSLEMTFPFVKLMYKGSDIGSSQSSGEKLVIPKNGELTVREIYVKIPLLGVFSLAYEIYKALVSSEPIKVQVFYSTIVKAAEIVPYTYEKTFDLTLKK